MPKLVLKCYTNRGNVRRPRIDLDLIGKTLVTNAAPKKKSTIKKKPGPRKVAELSLREGAGVSAGIQISI